MEDWDLQAVVRGCGSEAFANIMNGHPPPLFTPLNLDPDELFSFSEIFDPKRDFNAQEEIYEPLYHLLHQESLSSTPSDVRVTSSMSSPICEVKEPEKHPHSESATPASSSDATASAKSKRSRKNLPKRVVKHVTEDDLSSDMWAWRKYGQKPIKGSPYPRNYYRCSSLKGCLARKHVERSSTDPSMFIVTYTGEHSHAHPTRRNSLAGTTRIKSSMSKQATSNVPNIAIIKDECLDAVPSPTTHSMSSQDGLVQDVRTKNEEVVEEEEEQVNRVSNEIVMPDIIFSDDLFPSFDDFDEFIMDHPSQLQ